MDLDAPPVQLCIASTWDGALIPDDERATVTLRASADALIVEVTAQFHGDPPPATPPAPGGTWELWEHEVVELFLVAMPAGDGEGDGGAGGRPRYTELELGPHGHHLLLGLDGVRDPSPERALPLGAYEARVEGARWTGRAALPWDSFPARPSSAASASSEEPLRVNAFAIHGVEAGRRYLAATPVPGPHPDFHRLECFQPLADLPTPPPRAIHGARDAGAAAPPVRQASGASEEDRQS